MEELSAYRKEIKYVIPLAKIPALKRCMDHLMTRDNYCIKDAYRIRSVYFESINNIDFAQKLAGIDVRKKVRLRTYNGDESVCKLELKQKKGDLQHKQSLILSKEDAEALSKGHYEILTRYFPNSETAVKAYQIMRQGCYRPVVMVEYDRLVYQYPLYDTRVTLDMGIRSTEANLDIFSPEVNYTPIMCETAVLEIKYSGKCMGFLKDALGQFDLTQSSYSKYCSGRKVYYDFNY